MYYFYIFFTLSFLLLLVLLYAVIFLLSRYYHCSYLHKCCVICFLEPRVYQKQISLYTWQCRDQLCAHCTLPRPHLWDYAWYAVVLVCVHVLSSCNIPTSRWLDALGIEQYILLKILCAIFLYKDFFWYIKVFYGVEFSDIKSLCRFYMVTNFSGLKNEGDTFIPCWFLWHKFVVPLKISNVSLWNQFFRIRLKFNRYWLIYKGK